MARYRMEDGSVVDTEKASAHWDENTYFDGRNHISKATGSQWEHETLYRSRKGRFYTEHVSAYRQGTGHVEWISNEEAARWLLANDYSPAEEGWPSELTALIDEIVE